MKNMPNSIKTLLEPDYEMIEKSGDTIEIKIIKSGSLQEIIGRASFGVFVSYVSMIILNLNYRFLDKKIVYIILLSLCIMVNISLSFLFNKLRKNDILLEHDSFIVDKKIGLFYKNKKEICPISQISEIQIDIDRDSEGSDSNNLILILKDESKVKIYSSNFFGLLCDIADDMANFIDVDIYIEQ